MRFIIIKLLLLAVLCGCNEPPKSKLILIESKTDDWSISLKVMRVEDGTLIQGTVQNNTISNENGLMLVMEPYAGDYYKDDDGVFQKPEKLLLRIDQGQTITLNHKVSSLFEYYDLPNKLRPKLVARRSKSGK